MIRDAGSAGAASAHENASTPTEPSSTVAARASSSPRLFDNDVLKGRPGKYREDGVVQAEKAQVSRGIVDHGGADAADDDRQRERQEQQRQEELAGASGDGHRSEQRPDRADPEVGERDGRDRGRVDAGEEERERRQRDQLDEDEERERREQLPEPDRAAVARREHERVEHALLPLGDERAAEAEQRGEQDREPEQPGGRVRVVAREGEPERDEHRDDEERHRRQRVAPAQLEQQVLARERRGVADVAGHANATRPVANGSTRAGSWVATSSVRSPRSSPSSRSRSAVPSASRALNGSSRRSRSGSWSSVRQ